MVDKKIMNYDLISSQKDTWSKLIKKSESGKIANAYLFSGAVGSGKEGLALMFAQLLNCKSSKTKICFQCDSCIRFKSLQHEKLKIIILKCTNIVGRSFPLPGISGDSLSPTLNFLI